MVQLIISHSNKCFYDTNFIRIDRNLMHVHCAPLPFWHGNNMYLYMYSDCRWTCLLSNRDKMRGLKCEKITDKTMDGGRQVIAKAHIAFGKVS
jgi:hypothetical protein